MSASASAPPAKPAFSEIIKQFNAAAWMDAKIHRPSRLQQSAGKLFWTQGAVQELFCCDIADLTAANGSPDPSAIRKVIASEERKEKLSLEEELERERTRSRSVGVEAYSVSEDGAVILYRANGKWHYYDVAAGRSHHILANFKGEGFPTNFTAQKAERISFTCGNNLYIGTIAFDSAAQELKTSITQVTTIGSAEKLISCGAADYIIMEEFGRLTGHWVGEKYVLYTISLTSHLSQISILKEEEVEVMAYPRVGDANPHVIIALYNIEKKTYQLLPKAAIAAACEQSNGFVPEYFPRFGFVNADTLYVMAIDRAQERCAYLTFECAALTAVASEADLLAAWEAPVASPIPFKTLHKQSIPWAWIDVTDAVKIGEKRSIIGYAATETQPEKPFFHLHVTEDTTAESPAFEPLTSGDYNIVPGSVSVVGDYCFFIGGIHDYLGATVGAVRLGEKGAPTVALTAPAEHVYSFTVLTATVDGKATPTGLAFVSGTSTSAAKLSYIAIAAGAAVGEPVVVPTGWGMTLAGNWAADSPVKYDVIVPKLYRPTNRRGVVVPTLVHLPKNTHRADPATGKLPVYVYVYGGPHVQLVRAGDEYEFAFARYYQTLLHHGYAVVVIDNQMCHANHLKDLSVCKRNMGRFEVTDFTDALDGIAKDAELSGRLDLNRVAINGSSYGGYASLLALSQAPDRFRMAFAEAPVGDWKLYDTGYTERYMGLLPQDDEAYVKGAIPSFVDGFPDEPLRLFITHGLTDENVHFTNTSRVVDALEAAGKPFWMDVYPGERHGLRQKPTSIPHRRAQVISNLNALL